MKSAKVTAEPTMNSSNGGDQKHGKAPASEVRMIGKENWANPGKTKPRAPHNKSFATNVMDPGSIKPGPLMPKSKVFK